MNRCGWVAAQIKAWATSEARMSRPAWAVPMAIASCCNSTPACSSGKVGTITLFTVTVVRAMDYVSAHIREE